MNPPEPVFVLDLFPEERAALIELLVGLTPEEWDRPTACSGWTVKDVALHILGGDLGNIARRRDRVQAKSAPGEDLLAFVNRFNEDWVQATRRLSPRLIVDLLAFSGPQLFAYLSSLDLMALRGGVSWAGLDRAPVWLDVAREYTERWLHQQHIREAVGKPGLTGRRFFAPVLGAFVYALPFTFRDVDAPHGTAVHLHVSGEAGGDWSIIREAGGWTLYSGAHPEPTAQVIMGQEVAWRLFTRGLMPDTAIQEVSIEGDQRLGEPVLRAVAIIA
jgi:uncharacterized protein (TIGR03083 family)